jgi:recombination protein RecA
LPKKSKKIESYNISDALEIINKRYGEGAVVSASDVKVKDWVSTGIFAIDYHIFGGKGITLGEQHMLFGSPGLGKTSMCHMIAKQCQLKFPDKPILFILAEGKWSPEWATKFGLDPDRILVHYSSCMEDTFDVMSKFLIDPSTISSPANLFSMIMVDSATALAPISEYKKAEDHPQEQVRGTEQAKLISMFQRRVNRSLGDTMIIWINQVRANQLTGGEIPSLGYALQHYCVSMLKMRRTAKLTTKGEPGEESDVYGWRVSVYAEKNSTNRGNPHAKCYYNVISGIGVDQEQSIFEVANMYGILSKSGTWYKYREQSFQGAEGVKEAMRNDATLREEILEECYQKNSGVTEVEEEVEE